MARVHLLNFLRVQCCLLQAPSTAALEKWVRKGMQISMSTALNLGNAVFSTVVVCLSCFRKGN